MGQPRLVVATIFWAPDGLHQLVTIFDESDLAAALGQKSACIFAPTRKELGTALVPPGRMRYADAL